MRKEILLSLLILSMSLLLLSCKSARKTQGTVTPHAALIVESKQASGNLEVDKIALEVNKEVKADKEDTMIKHDDADVHYNLGVSYYKTGMYEEAIEAYNQALRIKPDYAEAHYNLGLTYGKLGMYEGAIEAYNQALNIKPDYTYAHVGLGYAYGKLSSYKEAIIAFKEAIRFKPDYAEAHYNLGLAYMMLDERNSVLEEYKILKELNPQMADNLNNEAIKKALSNKDNKFIIQVGAYKIIDNANKLFNKLKADYLYTYIEKINDLHNVRILGIKTKAEGKLLMKEIYKKFKHKPLLLNAH